MNQKHFKSLLILLFLSMCVEVLANGKLIPSVESSISSDEVKEFVFNNPPVVDAGVGKGITLPTNSLHILGTASDTDGSIVSYLWTKVSGPAATLNGANTLLLNPTGLVAGIYIFRLTVIDDLGAFAYDDMQLTVNPAPVGDSQAPATITNLSATALSSSSIQLSWTAPGDDGTTGTATVYDIRYSKTPIIIGNFTSGGYPPGVPQPSVAGTTQTITIAGLEPSTTYYFAMVARDDVGNQSALSNVPSAQTPAGPPSTVDTQPPATIANLTATALSSSSIKLSWTAPGDDGTTGTATLYDIRYSKTPLSIGNFGSGLYPGVPVPAIAGTTQTQTVTGLEQNTTYYFAMVARDEAGNQSALSNVPSVSTPTFTVNAGPDALIALPTNSTTLNGSASISQGTITSYQWTKTSGPEVTMNGASSPSLSLSNLVAGSYLFSLKVFAGSDFLIDEVSVVVVENLLKRDSLALVDLYNGMDGRKWTRKANWLTGPIETWQGVYLMNDRVDYLELGFNGLKGKMPASFGNLTALTNLWIGVNNITELPVEIGNCTALQVLDLSSSLIMDFPLTLGNLKNLSYLDLSRNDLSTIPAAVFELVKLNYLYLYNCNLRGTIPEDFARLPNLYTLYLNNNQLYGNLPNCLSTMHVSYIVLSNNGITGISTINRYRLQDLVVDYNKLDFGDFEYLYDGDWRPNIYADNQASLHLMFDLSTRTFSVLCRGTSNLYQWKRNGVTIAGATSSTLILTPEEYQANDGYECVITNTIKTDLILYTHLKHPKDQFSEQGDFITKASGNWEDHKIWQKFDGQHYVEAIPGEQPDQSNSVFIEKGHTLTLSGNKSCKNLNLNVHADVVRLDINEQALNVYGKLRLYSNAAPGLSNNVSAGIPGWINTGTNGRIRLKGNTNRVITEKNEFSDHINMKGWTLDCDLAEGVLGTINSNFRANDVVVTSGNLEVKSESFKLGKRN